MKDQRRLTILSENKSSIRTETIDGINYFVGYAAVYNSRSRLILENGKVFFEILLPGSFDRVLADPALDVVLCIDHEHKTNLGRTISGNVKLESDEIGLKFRALVPNTSLGRDTLEMISRGDYTDCSFLFSVNSDGETWERDGDGNMIHIISQVAALYDVTICTLRGAYEQTIIDVETASRMYKELDIQERGEPDGTENQDPGKTGDPGKPDPDESSNDNPGEEAEREIEAENDLDKMIVDLHKIKSETGSSL